MTVFPCPARAVVIAAAVALVGAGSFCTTAPAPAAPLQDATLSKYVYPLAPPITRPPDVSIDVTDNPDAQAWAREAQKLVREWFPQVWRLLATEQTTPPREIKLIFRKSISAPAYAGGNAITVNGEWIRSHPDDLGMMVHELTHLVQAYPSGPNKPGWLVEGIADYIRWWRYEPEMPRTRIDPLKASYRDSYRVTAAFLAWITAKYDRRIVPVLDRSLRQGKYSDGIFKEVTGKDLDMLWSEFAPKPAAAPLAEKKE